jgi:hypothetical protein
MTAKIVTSGHGLLARRSIRLLLASVFYLVCIVVFFQHNLPTITTNLMGPPEDNMAELWNTWYSQQLTSFDPRDWFFTDRLCYPEGASLLFHNVSYTNLALIRITRWLLDLPATIPVLVGANNIVLLASFYLSAVAAYLLAYHLTGNFLAAMIGGYIFAFSPFHFAYSQHHVTTSTIQYIPLFVLCVLRLEETKRVYYGIGAAVWFLLSALSSWYYLFYDGFFLVFFYLYRAVQARKIFLRPLLFQLGAILAASLLILSPLLVPMIQTALSLPRDYTQYEGHKTYVADLVGLFCPHPYHWAASYFSWIHKHLKGGPWGSSVYLGIVNIGLLGWAWRRHRGDALLRWSACGMLFFILLAGGRFLRILGVGVPMPLPTGILEHIPLFGMVRTPSRAIVYTYLFLGLAVARIMQIILTQQKTTGSKRLEPKKWRVLLPISLCVGILLDFTSINQESTPVICPPAYNVIAKGDLSAGVLNLPMTYGVSELAMMYQLCVNRPVVHANVSRKLQETLSDRLKSVDVAEWKPLLKSARVEYIVFHSPQNIHFLWNTREKIPPPDLREIERHFTLVYRDKTESLFRVD